MPDRSIGTFDQLDPFERQLLRRVSAWTDQAVVPLESTGLVPVPGTAVRGRLGAPAAGGRLPLLATLGVVAVLVASGLALRLIRIDTAQVSAPPAASAFGAVGTDGGVTGSPEPERSPTSSAGETAAPSDPGEPSAAPTAPAPSAKPTRPAKAPRPDPGATDAPEQTWHPAATFTGSVFFEDYCLATDGTEQVMLWLTWDSPQPIDEIWVSIDGGPRRSAWFSGGSPQYESRSGASDAYTIGSTHTATATFEDVDNEVIGGPIDSAPYTVVEGNPC